jgi:hypothetical protein
VFFFFFTLRKRGFFLQIGERCRKNTKCASEQDLGGGVNMVLVIPESIIVVNEK